MASNPDFVEYIRGQLSGAGEITCKKMFGDYGVYCDGKVIGLICDNQFFLKKTDAGLDKGFEEAPPYPGAKPAFLVDSADDREEMARLVRATYEALPEPKPRKKKQG